MGKCIHGKVRPCWICKHDYDRAAPYVATNWQQEAEEWKAECHRVSGELEANKSKMIDRSHADDLLAENIRLEADNARLQRLNDVLSGKLKACEAENAGLKNLCRFLAGCWSGCHDWACSHFAADNLMDFPMVQGTTNQNNLTAIGKQPYVSKELRKTVDSMLNPTDGTDIDDGTKPTSAPMTLDEHTDMAFNDGDE